MPGQSVKKIAKKSAKKEVKKPVKSVKPVKPVKKDTKKSVKKSETKSVKKVTKKPIKKVAQKPIKKETKKPVKKVAQKTIKKETKQSTTGNMGIPFYQEAKGEEYMNEKQLNHIEKILLAWRQSLMEEVDRTVSHMKDEAANFPDPSDRASQEEEFSLELRTRDRERKLIKKIEDSLERLRENDFGYCEACGIEIGLRRLEARPTATLCIDCKTLSEIKERQDQGS